MLKSYEAILENGQVTWLTDQPNVKSARIIVTILAEPAEASMPQVQRRTASPAIAQGRRTQRVGIAFLQEIAGVSVKIRAT